MKTSFLLFAVFVAIVGQLAHAQADDAMRKRNYNHDHNVAMRDFDPVSYFKGKPVKADGKIRYAYKGLIYLFSSNENMEEFKKSPAKYEPAYGGWCAYSMATQGKRVQIDPLTYKIVEGKLYLFSNQGGNNSLLRWNPSQTKYIVAADKNWVKALH